MIMPFVNLNVKLEKVVAPLRISMVQLLFPVSNFIIQCGYNANCTISPPTILNAVSGLLGYKSRVQISDNLATSVQ